MLQINTTDTANTTADANATGGAAAPPVGGPGGLPEQAARGLSRAAEIAGDIVRAVVPDFVLDRIPFLAADLVDVAADLAGVIA